MISTEREYVRSLSYIMEHYFPEMERPDLPQDLRGKRSIIFGNLEKLCDFHSQYFLKDLEQCVHSPLSVSACFLRHVSLSKTSAITNLFLEYSKSRRHHRNAWVCWFLGKALRINKVCVRVFVRVCPCLTGGPVWNVRSVQ